MKKIIAMIPARLGSQRVPKKNLRVLNGKPLIAYVIESALKSKIFNDIYINSEADIFDEIAEKYGIKYYKRPKHLASNETVNDDFAYDFIKNIHGDILVQLLPTSPLITPNEIKKFVSVMINSDYETLISVENHQIACAYNGKPLNFNLLKKHQSSQTMAPIQSYATVLMAWTYKSFIHHMKEFGCAYHGANGKNGYYVLKGLSLIDIDKEEDFALAEIAIKYRDSPLSHEKKYYQSQKDARFTVEYDVPKILIKDGVDHSDFGNENMPLVHIDQIIADMCNTESWCYRIINTENNSATLICQMPGEGNRLHYHPNWNEWWYIVDGKWKWEIEGQKYEVKKGDIVFIEKNRRHSIMATGNNPALRLAVSRDMVAHIYPKSLT